MVACNASSVNLMQSAALECCKSVQGSGQFCARVGYPGSARQMWITCPCVAHFICHKYYMHCTLCLIHEPNLSNLVFCAVSSTGFRRSKRRMSKRGRLCSGS